MLVTEDLDSYSTPCNFGLVGPVQFELMACPLVLMSQDDNKDNVDIVENHSEENTRNVTRTVWNTRMGTARTCVFRVVTGYFSSELISRLTQEAFRSWSHFNLEIFNECLLPDHYLLISMNVILVLLVYDVTSVDDFRISQVFKYK
jgi:hypothetical protein